MKIRFLGIWRGFYEFKKQSYKELSFDDDLRDLYKRKGFDEKHILFINTLKQELLKPHDCKSLEILAKKLYIQFNKFFEDHYTKDY